MYSPIGLQPVFVQSLSIEGGQAGKVLLYEILDGLAEALERVSSEKDSKASTAPKSISMYGKHLFGSYSRHE